MNNTGNHLRTAGLVAVLGSVLVLTSCSSQQNTEKSMEAPAQEERNTTEAEIDNAVNMEEREAALNELEDVRRTLNKRIEEVDDRMRSTEDQARLDRLRNYRFELEQNRARVEDEIRNIEVAEKSTWDTVRSKASTTAKDVGDWFERQNENVKDLFNDDDVQDGTEEDNNE